MADFHPKGAVADLYGIMTENGISKRACFLIDKPGSGTGGGGVRGWAPPTSKRLPRRLLRSRQPAVQQSLSSVSL